MSIAFGAGEPFRLAIVYRSAPSKVQLPVPLHADSWEAQYTWPLRMSKGTPSARRLAGNFKVAFVPKLRKPMPLFLAKRSWRPASVLWGSTWPKIFNVQSNIDRKTVEFTNMEQNAILNDVGEGRLPWQKRKLTKDWLVNGYCSMNLMHAGPELDCCK